MRRTLIAIIATVVFSFPTSLWLQAAELQAGVATVDITPPIPYRMSGYFSERLSTGVKDRLQAKAIYFEQAGEKAALVFCDIIGISPDVSKRARARISAATGIPVSHIAIAATHSHTGPLYFGALREHFHQRMLKKSNEDAHEKVDYPSRLVSRLVAAARKAQASKSPVRLQAGYAEEKRLSFNRRFHMKDGSVRFNPGQQNPNIVRVAGPIDPQVGIVALSKLESEKPHAAIVAFALHLDTVGGTEYSADYPRVVQQILRRSMGPGFVSLFGAGTCGDINHVDVSIKGRRPANEIGTMLGQTIEEQLNKLSPVKQAELAVRSATVQAPLQVYSKQEIDEAVKNMQFVDNRKLTFLERVKAYKINALQLRGGTHLPLEVQAFRLSSDVAIVTLPGEVFVEFGMAIKAASPFKTTLVVELTNDAPGYIPTKKAFAEGSYETVNSRVASGGGEMMVEAAIKLLRDLGK